MINHSNICPICQKKINLKSSIKCNLCNSISHYKCNKLSFVDSQLLKNDNDWLCYLCSKDLFPFTDLTEPKFITVNACSVKYSVDDDDSRLILQPSQNLSSLYNDFNNLSHTVNENSANLINCKYFDIDDINNLEIINNSSLSLFHLNIASLPKHIHCLEELLASMKIDFDIIAISESRINKNNVSAHNIVLQNYSFDHCPTESTAGGTALFINNNLSFSPRHDLTIYKPFQLESNFIEIVNPKRTNIIIGCIYRHPNMDLSDFIENYLSILLDKISKENKTVYLLGDFNVDLLKYDQHNLTNDFLDTLATNFFLPNIFLPTRIGNTSKTLIDNIFSNSLSNETVSGNISASISDHLPQFSIFPDIFTDYPSPKSNVVERDWDNFNQQNFILDYFELDINHLLNSAPNDVDKSFDTFSSNLNLLLDKHAPYKKISKYKLKLKRKPWISKGIKVSIDVKNKLLSKYIKAKDPIAKSLFQQKYKIHRNMLSTLMKRSKTNYFTNFFNENINNIKNTWKGIKNLISNSKSNFFVPHTINSNNNTLTDPKSISNAFNNYFCSIAQNIQSSIKFSHKSFQHYLTDPFEKSFFISPTDYLEVTDIIMNLNSNKSHGPNGIPTKILQLMVHELSPVIANLFNLSFLQGKFPSLLKVAKVIPLHKKSSKLLCSNYRPISILSNLDKILEKIIHKRLYKFLETNNIIYSLQFGFRKNYSTTLALLNLTENIKQELDRGKFGCGIFIDFQKAFDTVDHNILLQKLSYYGVRGKSNEWFKSYLCDRKQFVSINGFQSDLSEIKCGVPQGSVLGPLLFLIYINDLHLAIKSCKIHHFADDTNLLHFNDSIKKLNKDINYDLKQLVHWLNANKISLNVGKTELVLFKPKKKKIDYDLKLKLNGKKLVQTSSVKYLGIKIDSNLNWKEQQNSIAIKINKATAILSKMRHYVNHNTLKMVYYSIFESHTNYANIVWGQNIDSSNRLFLIQKKVLRIMHFTDRISHSDPLFSASKIIKIYDKVSIDNCVFISKSLSNDLPSIFGNWFIFSSFFHDHSLRSSKLGILKIPSFKTRSHGRMSFRINSIYTWNNLQRVLKDKLIFSLKPNKVKTILRNYYINQY